MFTCGRHFANSMCKLGSCVLLLSMSFCFVFCSKQLFAFHLTFVLCSWWIGYLLSVPFKHSLIASTRPKQTHYYASIMFVQSFREEKLAVVRLPILQIAERIAVACLLSAALCLASVVAFYIVVTRSPLHLIYDALGPAGPGSVYVQGKSQHFISKVLSILFL